MIQDMFDPYNFTKVTAIVNDILKNCKSPKIHAALEGFQTIGTNTTMNADSKADDPTWFEGNFSCTLLNYY